MTDGYDFIVVGGGTAGCLLASRIASAASKPSVALLETGEHNDADSFRRTYDRFLMAFTQPTLEYGYISTPQPGLDGREIPQTRGRGLGGSSQVNFQVWSLGARDEFDHWAAEVGDSDWAFESVHQKVKKIENLHDDSGKWAHIVKTDPENHGYKGDVDVSIGPYIEGEAEHIFNASIELGHEINPDVNSGNLIGFGISPTTSWKGRRVTGASAFIESKNLENLRVLTSSRVTKILVEGNRAIGVELENGKQLTAKKEVIVAAGAIDTPRLLLLSGIGPKADLQSLNIPVAKDLPGVGKALTDHPSVSFTYHMKPGFSNRLTFAADADLVASASEQWLRDGTGPLLEHYSTIPTAFLKAEETYQSEEFARLPQQTQELLRKPTVPSFEFALSGPLLPPTYTFEDSQDGYFTFFAALQNSQARGDLKLKSANSSDPPLISPNYLGHEYDMVVMIEAVRHAMKYMQTPTLKKFTKHAIHAPASSSNEDITDFLKKNVAGLWHVSGSAKMGIQQDVNSVVGPNLKVYGYHNLRVADLSVTPSLPSGHPQIVAYVIGEIAAEKIIKEHGL